MPPLQLEMPRWSECLLRPSRFKVIYGGRGSGKTWQVARALVLKAAQEPLRIACTREFQNSIDESAKKILELTIHQAKLDHLFTIQRSLIIGRNGSHFFFHGMEGSTEAIKGWESVDIVWVEEAQRMSESSHEILVPTIRKPGSEIWFTLNPKNRMDVVYRRYIAANPRQSTIRCKINYDSNPFLPDELRDEALACKLDEPQRFPHVWLGEPDDDSEIKKVLPFALIQTCVDAHNECKVEQSALTGAPHMGLDLADAGADKNAIVIRRGPLITYAEDFMSPFISKTVDRAHRLAREHKTPSVYYDAGGLGAGAKSDFARMEHKPGERYGTQGINFGGKVQGPDRRYNGKLKNKDQFARVGSQMAWTLRQRAMNTARLRRGQPINPMRCLFLDPETPNLNQYLLQLSQPEWKEDASGRVVIDKLTPEKLKSPDLFDATCLAFFRDVRGGLQALWR